MNYTKLETKKMWLAVVVFAVAMGVAGLAHAQGQAPAGGGGRGQGQAAAAPAPAPAAQQAAPIDLTGYWVSVITEDWRWRMVTPAKGDYASIPINVDAKKVGDMWDPAKDEAAGLQCKSYGAPAIMHVPERIHVTWQDDNTLKVETDAGQQTRLFHFGDWKAPANAAATWQGDSVATWEGIPGRGGRGGAGGGGGAPAGGAAGAGGAGGGGGAARGGGGGGPRGGNLKVVTTHLRAGYLRKNGVPYSDKATVTEYWDLYTEHLMTGVHQNEQWVVDTITVDDPTYLQEPWITSPNFKREADGSKWDPEPCSSTW